MSNISRPKGTRDFTSIEINKRNYLIHVMRKKFELFGFYPIETPSFENISTLIGKYGIEGDYLMFKLLHSGNFLKKEISSFFKKNKKITMDILYNFLIKRLSNKALIYDLTVPFVRYVSMHRNEIIFPFKRYQIQPVWRADNPQKERFREFYQCDADMIGYDVSLWQEIELIKLCDDIFTKFNFPIVIHINHRDILAGLIEISGISHNLWKDFTTSLDKWNKMGKHIVKKEMLRKGISPQSFEKIAYFLDLDKKESFSKKMEYFIKTFHSYQRGKKGIKDLNFIFQNIKKISLKNTKLKWDLSLARGMNYYTGIIFEIFPYHNNSSYQESIKNSIGGGGRYDQLSNYFGIQNLSGIGVSLGLDRIYLSMEKKNLLQNISTFTSKVLFINFGDKEVLYSYPMINFLRKKGISTQLYPNFIRVHKQFKYANDNHIPFVISIGKNEIEKNKIRVKYLQKRKEIEYDNIHEVIHNILT